MIDIPLAVLTVLVAVAAFWFYLEQRFRWRVFEFLPPLIFIYATPVVLNNTGVIPSDSPVYGGLGDYALPVFIALMLFNVNVPAAVRIMGKGVLVMLLGTIGVVVGGVVSYAIVQGGLDPLAWKGYGALAGSWIGGTGNMAGVAGALETPPEMLGLAVLADNLVYVIWLPILLGSKGFADRFNRWANVPEERLERMEAAANAEVGEEHPPRMQDYLYLIFWALAVATAAKLLAPLLPEVGAVLTTSTWTILLVTTFALGLSATPVRQLPGAHNLAMAIVYIFVAGMGARASLAGFDQAPLFVLGAYIWIFIHGAFCLAGAWLFRVDVHSAAIASAANIGGAASAPVVAAHHRSSLVPVSILMALIGYALGNYLAILTAQLCQWVGG